MEQDMAISIHALRGEGDLPENASRCLLPSISIHALRGEGDAISITAIHPSSDFNPRPPWGGRRGDAFRVRGDD